MAKRHMRPQVLFVDAYDSFSENICALLSQFIDADIQFIKIDAGISDVANLKTYFRGFYAIILGPGPGNPTKFSDIGIIPLVLSVAQTNFIPVLGICLGFQAICISFGAPVVRMPTPCHGLTKFIRHFNEDIFSNIGDVVATNYNSLGVRSSEISEPPSRSSSVHSSLSDGKDSTSDSCFFRYASHDLQELAWDDFGWTMAVRHKTLPFWGIQFHPESCKSSSSCRVILEGWWGHCLKWNGMYRETTRSKLGTPGGISTNTKCDSLGASALELWNTRKSNFWCPSCQTDIGPSDPLTKITTHLLRQAASSDSFVYTATIKLGSADSVAELCYEEAPSWTAMLESTKKGRFSIYAIPSPSNWFLKLFSKELHVSSDSGPSRKYSLPATSIFQILKSFLVTQKASGGDSRIPFWGGFLGFFSYELGLEAADFISADTLWSKLIPDASLVWVERSIVVDHLEDRAFIQSIRRNDSVWVDRFAKRVAALEQRCMTDSLEEKKLDKILEHAHFILPQKSSYHRSFHSCQQELLAGNSYELCLTVEAEIKLPTGESWPLYKKLRRCNPVPFAAYLKLGKTTVLSSSPEQFLSWSREGSIDMIPMKGTVKKSPDMDLVKASEILASPKESAENLMIADLIRHDLYRAFGSKASVEVVKLCEVIEHETVYQLVSHIRANPPADIENLEPAAKHSKAVDRGLTALQQTLPPGSMTGAPKKRSCEILGQLEQRPRGVYSGVLGYLDVGGGGNFSVCIRNAFSNDEETKDGEQTWRVGAGGAITALSNPDGEWEEMRTKMESVLRAFRRG